MIEKLSTQTSALRRPGGDLRSGYTTGACATAAASAAWACLLTGVWRNPIEITLPAGQAVQFALGEAHLGDAQATAGVVKDAGDDPDVTHGAMVRATVRRGAVGGGVVFRAGAGVGMVTRPGLPIPPGEPAINPVPRRMMAEHLAEISARLGVAADVEVEISVPGGAELAQKTWNPRLGIEGGISILGTTGIVKPYSCAAWIASIHRGVDVARAGGAQHVAAATGSTSERAVKAETGLADWLLLDMGDFAGGMLKYLRRHPVPQLTIAGGFAKLTKLGQGALDLHSSRSQVDMQRLAELSAQIGADASAVAAAPTAMAALEIAGPALAERCAAAARRTAMEVLQGAPIEVSILVVDRKGVIVARAGP
ncbi:MAG: cobalt-precorrin-5B (C(1))-methyltransferase [Neomegalonema sp.]|nr:cobalt-precorrin-5B (C(1))-methyltransferase [Neomegalonema sp.]